MPGALVTHGLRDRFRQRSLPSSAPRGRGDTGTGGWGPFGRAACEQLECLRMTLPGYTHADICVAFGKWVRGRGGWAVHLAAE